MKKCHIILIQLFLLVLGSCSLDNFDAPESTFRGRIVYNGEPINVERSNDNIGNANVYFELWEPGWQVKTPIRVVVGQDGSFSAKLFNANYKLVIPRGQGPYMSKTNTETNSDTINVQISGDKAMDIEVLPYYMIRNSAFTVNGRTVTATCSIEKIITDANARDIEEVRLYIGKTTFVDGQQAFAQANIAGSAITNLNSVSVSVNVPTIPATQINQNYFYARIGLKIRNVEDRIFSPVQKVTLQ